MLSGPSIRDHPMLESARRVIGAERNLSPRRAAGALPIIPVPRVHVHEGLGVLELVWPVIGRNVRLVVVSGLRLRTAAKKTPQASENHDQLVSGTGTGAGAV